MAIRILPTLSLVLISALIAAASVEEASAQSGVSLPASYLYRSGKVRCGFVAPSWEVGTMKAGLFLTHKAKIASLQASKTS